ncbi:hypothetical protein F1C10_11145 [Sphingomonas sp. NBWT7]|uniref:hypothetical protein n=1 Tax=Sphingomonas sp. NBWT7 TaxID=2596913 RepID=UPI00162991CC|nr:hypothetical protein [Sphingomonas sp. NBWT7]QNE32445.1 hypothetical protein F1C10_11145 [Sphingomonas sp. NBWT7]
MGLPAIQLAPDTRLDIGPSVALVSRSVGTALGVAHRVVLRCLTLAARRVIGDHCGLSGASICTAISITVEKRCLFGADVLVFNTDFHNHAPENRRHVKPDDSAISRPVTTGADVFIGTRAIVGKGDHNRRRSDRRGGQRQCLGRSRPRRYGRRHSLAAAYVRTSPTGQA